MHRIGLRQRRSVIQRRVDLAFLIGLQGFADAFDAQQLGKLPRDFVADGLQSSGGGNHFGQWNHAATFA